MIIYDIRTVDGNRFTFVRDQEDPGLSKLIREKPTAYLSSWFHAKDGDTEYLFNSRNVVCIEAQEFAEV